MLTRLLIAGALLLTCTAGVAAQVRDTTPARPARAFIGLTTIASPADEHLRLLQLRGEHASTGLLIRSASTIADGPPDRRAAIDIALIAPELTTVWNSALPYGFNDGPLWAGRGGSLRLLAGARARLGPLSLIVAPELVAARNKPFQTIPYPRTAQPERSPFASPFHGMPESIDLPLRFGDETITRLDPGQSSLTLTAGPVAFGAATENLWWGPGVRNAIVMSSHAPGIPHLFVRTSRPLRTPAGQIEGRAILGTLRDSEYFDLEASGNTRSISAFALALHPAFEPNLAIGLARAVYARSDGEFPLGAAFDALRSVGSPNAVGDAADERAADQILSVFGRWVFPASGFETYFEWARNEEPRSLRDLVETPHHSQGYTLGLQWTNARAASAGVRLQGEVTYLEPSGTYRVRPVQDWYTSRVVPQGYTHRGQAIGSSIGPGASSQWLASDYLARSWQLGVFSGRIRWDNAAFHTYIPEYRRPDVSIFAGLRAAVRVAGLQVAVEGSTTSRMNYLFQAQPIDEERYRGVDVRNHSLRLTLGTNALKR